MWWQQERVERHSEERDSVQAEELPAQPHAPACCYPGAPLMVTAGKCTVLCS